MSSYDSYAHYRHGKRKIKNEQPLKPQKLNKMVWKGFLMPISFDDLPEIFVSNTEISALVNQAVKAGKLRKLGSRLYTKDMDCAPENIVKRNWYFLLKDYYPDALIADRTAIENQPAADGSVFIVSS